MSDASSPSGDAGAIDEACRDLAPAFTRGRSPARDDLLWTAMNAWASTATVTLVRGLPQRSYRSLAEVRDALASSPTPDAPGS